MKKIIPAIALALVLFPACGKIDLKSEKKGMQSLTVSGPLSAQDFTQACAIKGGVIETGGAICAYQIYARDMAPQSSNKYVTSQTTADYPLTDIPSGSAVKVTGISYGGIELMLNNAPFSAIPTPGNRPVITDGGSLSFRLHPGSYYGVNVYVFSCLNQAMKPTRCPY